MTAPKRLTRRLFWRHWPEVAPGFEIDAYGLLRDANRHCPITAVAARLGLAVGRAECVGDVLPWPRPIWAQEVVDLADFEGRRHLPAYRRLVEHIPEGNR